MAEVKTTIAVPIYNARKTIDECLETLAHQTVRDFRVVIHDNASTDGTSEFCADYAAKDSRFVHIRNDENVGGAQNFLDALAACETEYFAWRADDDLSSLNFVEKMQAQLEAAPNAAVSAPRVESRRPAKGRVKHAGFVRPWGAAPRVVNVLRQMFFSHPSWIYGLWRTQRLRDYYLLVWEKYPVGWANDHLVLLQPILDQAVVGDNEAAFIQQIGLEGAARGAAAPARPPFEVEIAERRQMLHRFRKLCRESLDARDWSGPERLLMGLLIERYADKRVNSSEFKLWRMKMRYRLLGRH